MFSWRQESNLNSQGVKSSLVVRTLDTDSLLPFNFERCIDICIYDVSVSITLLFVHRVYYGFSSQNEEQ